MPEIKSHVNLKSLNTFGIEVYGDYFVEISNIEDLLDLLQLEVFSSNKKLILGGGSNVLFISNYNGLIIKNNLKGKSLVSENDDEVVVKAAAGENWHEFVSWCISKGYGGLENLSLIPGCVGASPMQNIGAYGVEIKDVFEELHAYDLSDGSEKVFTHKDCAFGYRESVFKRHLKDRYFIASVTFRLKKHPSVNTTYGAINSELALMGITNPNIKDVSDAVIRIRQSKLPDPKVMGNAGSFFKNPEVSAAQHTSLKTRFPEIVAYNLPNGNYKLAAGWLIEQCGLKGIEIEGAAVHTKQALVLVNKNNCSGQALYNLSSNIMQKVVDKFGVQLEREVNVIG